MDFGSDIAGGVGCARGGVMLVPSPACGGGVREEGAKRPPIFFVSFVPFVVKALLRL
jgi:hypothetical protein